MSGQFDQNQIMYAKNEYGRTTYYPFNLDAANCSDIKQFYDNWSHCWGNSVYFDDICVIDPIQLFKYIKVKGLRDLHPQQYKGLGEMHTEDPKQTAMSGYRQVNVESLKHAAELCDILMGEHVEQRRTFIQSNAKFTVLDL